MGLFSYINSNKRFAKLIIKYEFIIIVETK